MLFLVFNKLTGYKLCVRCCKPHASEYSRLAQMNTGETTWDNSTARGCSAGHSAVVTTSSQDLGHLLQQDILEKESFSEKFLLTNYTLF